MKIMELIPGKIFRLPKGYRINRVNINGQIFEKEKEMTRQTDEAFLANLQKIMFKRKFFHYKED